MNPGKVAMLNPATALLLGLFFLTDVVVTAQNPQTKEELAAIEQTELSNQTKLSHYTWQETQFISVNGEAVDYRLYSASIGPNGQNQRNLVTEHTGQAATFEPKTKEQLSQHGLYAQQLCELANQYTLLDSERVTRANSRGDVVLLREDGAIKLAIKNYAKPGDSLAMTIDQLTRRVLTVQAKSYLTDPRDSVTIQAEFAELPDGTNHVATAEIDNVSRHLAIKLTDWSYQ